MSDSPKHWISCAGMRAIEKDFEESCNTELYIKYLHLI